MKGWVGLVGWPVADGLPTLIITHQLQVERRTAKVLQSETDVLPLCYATNMYAAYQIAAIPMSLSDLQDDSHIASLFIRYFCSCANSCASVDNISADIHVALSRGPSDVAELLVLLKWSAKHSDRPFDCLKHAENCIVVSVKFRHPVETEIHRTAYGNSVHLCISFARIAKLTPRYLSRMCRNRNKYNYSDRTYSTRILDYKWSTL